MTRLEFFDHPEPFLAAAGSHLSEDPVLGTVVATVSERLARDLAAGVDESVEWPRWWLVVRGEADEVVGAGMRTAPFAPYPPYLMPMPEAAAVELARALHARGEEVGGVNGARPTIDVVAAETVRLAGGRVEVAQHTRLFELGDLVAPAPAPGRLRTATVADLEVVTAWFAAFHADADEQAGREPGSHPMEGSVDPEAVRRRVESGYVWLWVDEAGEPVHLTAANPPSFGVARIGPVYTPPAHRRHGYAAAAVGAVSRLLLDAGARVCLFTDQANPTSNGVYLRLGFRPVVDMANLVLVEG